MKNSFSTLLILMFLLCMASAGAQRFGAGVVLGFNASQIDGDMLAGYNKLGLHIGLKSSVYMSDRIDLNVEFLYSERGSADPDGPKKIRLQYIELPILMTYMDWLSDDEEYYRLHFHGGFSLGRLFKTGIVDDSGVLTSYEDLLRKNDLSLLGGFTYKINQHWGVGARYTSALTRLSKGDGSDTLPDLQSYFLSFRIEYSIL